MGERKHSELHYKLSNHPIVLNIRRTKKPKVEVSWGPPCSWGPKR